MAAEDAAIAISIVVIIILGIVIFLYFYRRRGENKTEFASLDEDKLQAQWMAMNQSHHRIKYGEENDS